MTTEEFNKEKDRVDNYDKLNKRIEQLSNDRSKISNGLLKIITFYQREVLYNTGRDGDYELEDRLVTAICSVYDNEINQIKSIMNNI